MLRNVKAESFIAAFMLTHGLTVQKDQCPLIRRSDVQEYPAAVETFRQRKSAVVAQQAFLFVMDTQTGEAALRAERHANLPLIFVVYGKIPGAVQIQIAFTFHLGSGINPPGSALQVLAGNSRQFIQHGLSPSYTGGS